MPEALLKQTSLHIFSLPFIVKVWNFTKKRLRQGLESKTDSNTESFTDYVITINSKGLKLYLKRLWQKTPLLSFTVKALNVTKHT